MDDFLLKGQIALVIGASRGVGRAIALGLGRAEADLLLMGRNTGTPREVAAEIESLGRKPVRSSSTWVMPVREARAGRSASTGAARSCSLRPLGRHMIGPGYGRVANATSVLADESRSLPYSRSNAALRSMTQSLAADWAPQREVPHPGRRDPDFYAAVTDRVAQRRWGAHQDLAGPAVFLASATAPYVTGATLTVDGGYRRT